MNLLSMALIGYELYLKASPMPPAPLLWPVALDISYVICLPLVAASPQPLTLVHYFKVVRSDRFGGLSGCWVFVVC